MGATFRPTDRIIARMELGISNDEDVAAGFVRREFKALDAGWRLGVDLTDELFLRFGYRFSDTELRREPVLLRTENLFSGSLTWTPLRALNGVLSIQRRTESEEEDRLQSSRSVRLLVSTAFLPDLRLISDAQVARTDDPFSGFDRRSWIWRETLSARPTSRWTVGGVFGVSNYRTEPEAGSSLAVTLRKRTEIGLSTTWSATPLLTLGGSWFLGREDGADNVSLSYNLSYNPGPKLSVSAIRQEYETLERRATASDSLSLRYQLNRHASLSGSFYRSRTEEFGEDSDELTSLRVGLRFSI
jgi:hypothetical protein